MNSYLLGLNTLWLVGLTAFVYWRNRKPKSYTFDSGYTEPEIKKHSPFTRGTKKGPKVNDDERAWKIENKLN